MNAEVVSLGCPGRQVGRQRIGGGRQVEGHLAVGGQAVDLVLVVARGVGMGVTRRDDHRLDRAGKIPELRQRLALRHKLAHQARKEALLHIGLGNGHAVAVNPGGAAIDAHEEVNRADDAVAVAVHVGAGWVALARVGNAQRQIVCEGGGAPTGCAGHCRKAGGRACIAVEAR